MVHGPCCSSTSAVLLSLFIFAFFVIVCCVFLSLLLSNIALLCSTIICEIYFFNEYFIQLTFDDSERAFKHVTQT